MNFDFETSRLVVTELTADGAVSDRTGLLLEIPEILTPVVVAYLPPHFSGICSSQDAEAWLDRMYSESHLLLVTARVDKTPVGFLFVHVGQERDAHIGFLLRESHWGQGLASELLRGFIDEVRESRTLRTLIGGVSLENTQSQRLFEKLDFSKRIDSQMDTLFYEIALEKSDV
ncbi:GNAT family N-acetyltransferase [Microbulbifer agarilyticus]|uniref:GNAT family N-acetyltransferase n=1 Tax=Microbulbifer agarilyticus TaxID=260552 RepID=UPI001C94C406|nr:GNAT family N-acetyltransferase [Microbulbifer agarilyticus]MBY6210064.1 GNAT family N-acetyltransferase [Microbulbifer agarilyticus]